MRRLRCLVYMNRLVRRNATCFKYGNGSVARIAGKCGGILWNFADDALEPII